MVVRNWWCSENSVDLGLEPRLETQGLREAVLLLSQQIDAKVIVLEPEATPAPAALETQEPVIPFANPG